MTRKRSESSLTNLVTVLLLLLAMAVSACGSGGGSGSAGLSNNACQVLGLQTKIINGTACTNLNDSPVVRITLVDRRGRQSFCTGSMLTPQYVVTAGHCITVTRPVRVFIMIGESLAESVVVEAEDWIVHPDFHSVGSSLVADVAVLRLEQGVDLPTLPILESQSVEIGDVVSIFGYGQDENGDFDFEELKSGEMRVSEVTVNHIQALYEGEGSNTCLGDSGGPLLLTVNGTTALVGITSTGTETGCGPGDTSFFTNLQDPAVLQFLKDVVEGHQVL